MTHKASSTLPSYALFIAINLGYGVNFSQGTKPCEGYPDCVYKGYTCKNNKCVCDPESEGPRIYPPCELMKTYGEKCTSDLECSMSDPNLHCAELSDVRVCKCRKGMWEGEREKKSCYVQYDTDIYNKFEPVRDLVIPAIIVMTIGAMVYLGFKLFCNCGKLWRSRRHQEIAREFEEISATPHQQATWIASYRVFSPYNNANRSSSGLSPTSFPIHPTPCMGLFVPSQTISTSPPTYEEALKHKVILSSYHPPPGPQVVPVPVPAYTLPPPDIPRQYQTLPANSSGPSSTIILNPNAPTASTIRISTMSGPRSLPIAQTDNYIHDPLWTHQYQYSGTTGQIWNPGDHQHHQQQQTTTAPQPTQFQDVWMPQSRNQQQQDQHHNDFQNRTSTFRPGPQPQRTYQNQGSDPTRSVLTNDRDN